MNDGIKYGNPYQGDFHKAPSEPHNNNPQTYENPQNFQHMQVHSENTEEPTNPNVTVSPTDAQEDVILSPSTTTGDEDDAFGFTHADTVCRNTTEELVDAWKKEYSDEKTVEQCIKTKDPIFGKVLECIKQISAAYLFNENSIKNSNTDEFTRNVDGIYDSSARRFANSGDGSDVNPEIAFAAKLHGVKKVYLYNSGFYIVIRPLALAEINKIYTTCKLESKEYGWILGGLFLQFADIHYKRIILDVCLSAVIDSNYKKFRRKKDLLNVISINDYDSILWAFASIMFKEVDLRVDCFNRDDAIAPCNFSETVKLDIRKLRYEDKSKLSMESRKFLADPSPKGDKELERYREKCLNQEYIADIGKTDTGLNLKIHFKVPTMSEIFAYSERFLMELLKDIDSEDTDSIDSIFAYQQNRILNPWSKELLLIDEENPNDTTKTSASDIDKFNSCLDMVELDSEMTNRLHEAFKKFVIDSRISHIAYKFDKCPNCGYEYTINGGFIPYDVQRNFFMLAQKKLYYPTVSEKSTS